jgi:GNAT superfamily N-acetyltransferase
MAEIHLRQDDATNTRIVAHRYLYISCIIVRDAARAHGVGRRLMDEAEAWGRTHAAGEVRLDAWEIPDGPLAFYAKRGYQTMKRTLVKPL